jgi:hypothetical protein
MHDDIQERIFIRLDMEWISLAHHWGHQSCLHRHLNRPGLHLSLDHPAVLLWQEEPQLLCATRHSEDFGTVVNGVDVLCSATFWHADS